jgi:L,D-transpeptidase catalytic domain
MSEDRRTDSSRGTTVGRKPSRVIRFFLGIGLLIFLAVALLAGLNLPEPHTVLERQTLDQNTSFRDSEKPGLPENREKIEPLAEKSPAVSRVPTEPEISSVPLRTETPSVDSSQQTIEVVIRPRKRLASIPRERPKEMIFRDLEERVEEPEPKRTYTVAQRLAQYGEKSRKRLKPHFEAAGVRYPAKAVTLVGLKKEGRLELYAGKTRNDLKFIRHFPIQAASGVTGPKLKQGDKQVPEGLYRIVLLNPNSRFHLSLRVSYPNSFDIAMGRKDRRSKLGGDIMIHGDCVSEGCLAMGDEAAEELFVLASDTGLRRMRLILSPIDFRIKDLPKAVDTKKRPNWTNKLYAKISKELDKLPLPPASRASRLEEFSNAVFSGRIKKLWPLY